MSDAEKNQDPQSEVKAADEVQEATKDATLTSDLVAEASGAMDMFDSIDEEPMGAESGAKASTDEEASAEVHEEGEEAFEELDQILAEGDESEPMEATAETSEEEGKGPSLSEGSELEAYESASIEEEEFLEDDQVSAIIESILFSTDKPQSFATIKQAFKGTNIAIKQIRRAMDLLATEYAGARRGVTLEEVTGGFQLRTKVDNMPYLKRMLKVRTFKLSGPALEVLSIVAYKQPCIKADVDDIRGVESGHLMRGLLDRGMLAFAGKSELPGKPMYYQTTRKFLEIFGLRSLKELPSLSEIDELIPEGIDEQEEKKTLDMLTEDLSEEVVGKSYSEGEEELSKITDKLSEISTTTDFFEQEKQREREKRDAQRAQDIRERLVMEEEVPGKDVKWLERYEAKLKEAEEATAEPETNQETPADEDVTEKIEVENPVMEAGEAGGAESVGEVVAVEIEDDESFVAESEELAGDYVEDFSLAGIADEEPEEERKGAPKFDESADSWSEPVAEKSENMDHDVDFDADLIAASEEGDPEPKPEI